MKVADIPGELIAIIEASSVIAIEPLRDDSAFDVSLSINRNGGQYHVRLTGKESRAIGRALIEAAVGVKTVAQHDRSRSRGWRD